MGRDSSLIFDHTMLVQTLHVFATIVFAYNTYHGLHFMLQIVAVHIGFT